MYRNCKCKKCSLSNCSNYQDNMMATLPANIDNLCGCNMPDTDNCECGFDEDTLFPRNPYVCPKLCAMQTMDKVFTPQVGLKMGTIFPELVSP